MMRHIAFEIDLKDPKFNEFDPKIILEKAGIEWETVEALDPTTIKVASNINSKWVSVWDPTVGTYETFGPKEDTKLPENVISIDESKIAYKKVLSKFDKVFCDTIRWITAGNEIPNEIFAQIDQITSEAIESAVEVRNILDQISPEDMAVLTLSVSHTADKKEGANPFQKVWDWGSSFFNQPQKNAPPTPSTPPQAQQNFQQVMQTSTGPQDALKQITPLIGQENAQNPETIEWIKQLMTEAGGQNGVTLTTKLVNQGMHPTLETLSAAGILNRVNEQRNATCVVYRLSPKGQTILQSLGGLNYAEINKGPINEPWMQQYNTPQETQSQAPTTPQQGTVQGQPIPIPSSGMPSGGTNPTASIKVVSRIVKKNDKWFVYSEDGKKKLGGPYSSRGQAVKRLQQVEYFKHKGEVISKEYSAEFKQHPTHNSESSWLVYEDAEPIFAISAKQAFGGTETIEDVLIDSWEHFASSTYGEMLVKELGDKGIPKVLDTYFGNGKYATMINKKEAQIEKIYTAKKFSKGDFVRHIPTGKIGKVISAEKEWVTVNYGDIIDYTMAELLEDVDKKEIVGHLENLLDTPDQEVVYNQTNQIDERKKDLTEVEKRDITSGEITLEKRKASKEDQDLDIEFKEILAKKEAQFGQIDQRVAPPMGGTQAPNPTAPMGQPPSTPARPPQPVKPPSPGPANVDPSLVPALSGEVPPPPAIADVLLELLSPYIAASNEWTVDNVLDELGQTFSNQQSISVFRGRLAEKVRVLQERAKKPTLERTSIFKPGDLVEVGQEIGEVIAITEKTAKVKIAAIDTAKEHEVPLDEIFPVTNSEEGFQFIINENLREAYKEVVAEKEELKGELKEIDTIKAGAEQSRKALVESETSKEALQNLLAEKEASLKEITAKYFEAEEKVKNLFKLPKVKRLASWMIDCGYTTTDPTADLMKLSEEELSAKETEVKKIKAKLDKERKVSASLLQEPANIGPILNFVPGSVSQSEEREIIIRRGGKSKDLGNLWSKPPKSDSNLEE